MTTATTPREQDFRDRWSDLRPLIVSEWPAVDEADLDDTSGEFEAVVTLVARATEHTRTLIRKQLGELMDLSSGRAGLEARLGAFLTRLESEREQVTEQVHRARDRATALVDEAQTRGLALADEVRDEVTRRVPDAEARIKDNLWTSLLAALGIGVLLGMIVGRGRGR
jgi:ElaB/YqjD/DUF883 family membrane-anchored ribosome-binding protein